MRVLVTGSKGQLGSILNRLAPMYPHHSFFFYSQNELDICSVQQVRAILVLHHIEIVVNCAAYTLVDQAEENASVCYAVNQQAVLGIGQVAKELGIKVIHFSTDYVFDGTSYLPYTEENPVNPMTIYGDSKWKGEQELMKVCPESVIIRTSWLYSDVGANFMLTMLRLGKEKKQLRVVYDQIGTPTSAVDLAHLIFHILDTEFIPGIYHYSNEGVCSWFDFAKAIHCLAGITTCEVLPILSADYPTKAKRPHYSVLNKTKIKQIYKVNIPHWYDSLCGVLKEMNF